IVDRFPKRKILYVTQSAQLVIGLALGILIITETIELWMVFATALLNGLIKVMDNPTRQTFVREMVGNEHLTNAVSLNSMTMNLARVVGPAIAGILASTVGLGMCFVIGGLAYLAVLFQLSRMRSEELKPAPISKRAKGQLAAGWNYVRNEPAVR